MKKTIALIVAALMYFTALTAHAELPAAGTPGAPNDPRYCGEPARDKRGVIKRSQTQLKRFVAVFPCPATLESSTTCEGWAIDHIWPLADGGCDTPINMIWLPDRIKSCADDYCVDRWERKYFNFPRQKIVILDK